MSVLCIIESVDSNVGIAIYSNDSEVLSMLFECLDLWVEVFRQRELALSSIQRKVDSVFERTLGPVILQPILSV